MKLSQPLLGLLVLSSVAANADTVNVCVRHPALKSAVMEKIRHSHPGVTCDVVPSDVLSRFRDFSVDFYFPHQPVTLRPEDFAGMPDLRSLHIAQRGAPLGLGAHFFASMPKLTSLRVENNALGFQVDENTFAGLPDLETLDTFGLLKPLPKLQKLMLMAEGPFPAGFFSGLKDLNNVWLSSDSKASPLLPAGSFDGLANVKRLTLYGSLSKEASAELLKPLVRLESLYLPGHPAGALTLNSSYRVSAYSRQTLTCEESVASADENYAVTIGGSETLCQQIGGAFTTGPATYDPRCQQNEENLRYRTVKGAQFICER